jgi:drug/metabolite transporter (DMT)-like permease
MAGSTICSNIMSIVGVWIIAKIDVSLYTALSSALSIITAVVGSVLFRERLGFFSYLAMIFAIIAIII